MSRTSWELVGVTPSATKHRPAAATARGSRKKRKTPRPRRPRYGPRQHLIVETRHPAPSLPVHRDSSRGGVADSPEPRAPAGRRRLSLEHVPGLLISGGDSQGRADLIPCRKRGAGMGRVYSADLRGRVIDAVEAGSSARSAAARVWCRCGDGDPVGAAVPGGGRADGAAAGASGPLEARSARRFPDGADRGNGRHHHPSRDARASGPGSARSGASSTVAA